ncbi:MAG TPA: Smr/MutS family protein [Pusillimonas sp.]|uniref:Smr/MutS family protein n=1 Tax=Pusillimonas sp. TaxID=3040095 RepID=UPI002C9C921E|nr:Smr/MutS family protein [Pusillimonas sp.]HUH87822.1 Smr/MutS family protein [Pusillimonas sp.]
MRANKPGLADLKQLRKQTLEAAKPAQNKAAAKPATNNKRKKRGFMPPGGPPPGGPAPVADTVLTPAGSNPHTGNLLATDPAELLDPADRVLFRQVVKSVQRLPAPNRALLPPVPVAPKQVLIQRRERASGNEPAALPQVSDHYTSPKLVGDPTCFVQANHGPDLVKNLAKGKWPIGASLDLHGATLDEARARFDAFLRSCIEHQIRCVRVVHGKGYGSKDNTPVLKETVRRWLTQIADVMAYVECAERDGGAGAVLVLLRANDS